MLLLAAALPTQAFAAASPPFTQCPAIGADSGCALLIDITSSGKVGVYGDPSQAPFDNVEDTLIGVKNDSSVPLSSIPLSATAGKALFDFDGDGLCSASPRPSGCPLGSTGYEGPGVSFTNISADKTSGTVNFSPAVPPGGSAYFSLEDALATQPPFDIAPGPPNGGIKVSASIADNSNEPAVAVNPTNPKNLVVAYNHFHSSKDVRCGYQYTTDGGQTWHGPLDLQLPHSVRHAAGAGDPSLAFNSNGDLFFSCLTNGDAGAYRTPNLYAAILQNGGSKAGPPRLLIASNSWDVVPDQEALAGAPSGGAVYMCQTLYVATRVNSKVQVERLVERTGRGGPMPVIVKRASASTRTHQVNPIGCTVSVAASGRVWTAWWDAGLGTQRDAGRNQAFAAYSDNGAISFTGPTPLGTKRGEYWDGGVPSNLFYPQRRVDIQASPVPGDSRVLAVWEDVNKGTDNIEQAVLSGGSWGAPSIIATMATQPSVSWGADGTVLYGYYSNPNFDASRLFYGMAQSSGPATGTVAFMQAPLTASSEMTSLAPSHRFGDYNGVAEAGGTGYGVWTDNSPGHQTVTLGQVP